MGCISGTAMFVLCIKDGPGMSVMKSTQRSVTGNSKITVQTSMVNFIILVSKKKIGMCCILVGYLHQFNKL